MKQKIILFFSILLFSTAMNAQHKIFETHKDPKGKGSNILVGQLNLSDIETDGTCGWMARGIKEYKPDTLLVKDLKKIIQQFEFIVCIGTWCGDTQDLFPKFWKTLKAAGYPMDKIELIGMDRDKHALQIEHQLLRIEYLPTIIIRKGPLEAHRIVESIEKKSIEQELMYFLSKFLQEEDKH
jgi:hypothetical protein